MAGYGVYKEAFSETELRQFTERLNMDSSMTIRTGEQQQLWLEVLDLRGWLSGVR